MSYAADVAARPATPTTAALPAPTAAPPQGCPDGVWNGYQCVSQPKPSSTYFISIGLVIGGAYLGYRMYGLSGMVVGTGIGCGAVALLAAATLGSVRY